MHTKFYQNGLGFVEDMTKSILVFFFGLQCICVMRAPDYISIVLKRYFQIQRSKLVVVDKYLSYGTQTARARRF